MTAERLLNLADALRQCALSSGRDLNASNLFVHTMLAQAIATERATGRIDPDVVWAMLADRSAADAQAA